MENPGQTVAQEYYSGVPAADDTAIDPSLHTPIRIVLASIMSKVYRLSEIEAHSSKSSLYLSIHGNVYDVTEFIDQHPYASNSREETFTATDTTQWRPREATGDRHEYSHRPIRKRSTQPRCKGVVEYHGHWQTCGSGYLHLSLLKGLCIKLTA